MARVHEDLIDTLRRHAADAHQEWHSDDDKAHVDLDNEIAQAALDLIERHNNDEVGEEDFIAQLEELEGRFHPDETGRFTMAYTAVFNILDRHKDTSKIPFGLEGSTAPDPASLQPERPANAF